MGKAEEHLDNACSCLRLGKFNDAIKEYQKALEADPQNALAHKSLAALYYRQTKLDESIVEYEKAIEINPKYSDAHYELGISLYRRGRLEDAIRSFKEALKINPNFHIARYWLGLSYYYGGRLSEAIEAFKQTIANEPNVAIAYYHLGIAYTREDKWKSAVAEFENFLKKTPNSAAAHYQLGVSYYKLGDVDQAIEHFRRAVEIDPSDERSRKNLDSIEELLLVRGVTPELFYGKKGTWPGEGGKEKGNRIGLKDIFSIYALGEQVDINSATLPVLRFALGIPSEIARGIIQAREEKVFENQQDLLQRVPELGPFLGEIGRFILFQSTNPFYTIEAQAQSKNGKSVRGLKAIVKIDPREKGGYKIIQWVDAFVS